MRYEFDEEDGEGWYDGSYTIGKDRHVLTKEVSVSAKSGNAPSLILTAPGQRG